MSLINIFDINGVYSDMIPTPEQADMLGDLSLMFYFYISTIIAFIVSMLWVAWKVYSEKKKDISSGNDE